RVRPGDVTAKQFADRGQLETTVVKLAKYSGRSQRPHQSIECQRMRVGRLSKLTAGYWTRRQQVRQSKGGSNMDHLAHPEPHKEPGKIGTNIMRCHVRLSAGYDGVAWGRQCAHITLLTSVRRS